MKKFFVLIFSLIWLMPAGVFAQALDYDLGISTADIFFSKPITQLVENQPIRIYATIRNYGTKDAAASVLFFNGSSIIGESQVVSVRVDGLADEVYVDWVVPMGVFNIRAEIKAPIPDDQNLANNLAITALITPLKDTDGDGIPDTDDPDDDNDGVSDADESTNGSNPLIVDTDGDGVGDATDLYPTDPSKSSAPIVVVVQEETPDVSNHEDNQSTPPVNPEPKSPVTPSAISPGDNGEETTVEEPEDKIEYETEAFNKLQYMPGFNLLGDVKIKTESIGWGKYNFNFETDSPEVNPDNLIFEWNFGDGKLSKENGEHSLSEPEHIS
jgi:hypothetical protein